MVGYVTVHVYHTVQLEGVGGGQQSISNVCQATLVWHRSMFVMLDHDVKARWTSE